VSVTVPSDSTPAETTLRLRGLSLHYLRPPRRAVVGYAWSAAAWLAAFALTVTLATYIRRANFVFFWVAVLFAAWYGGFLPALVAAAAAVLVVHYYFVEPVGQLWPVGAEDLLTLGIFGVAALLVSALAAALAHAQRQAEANARELAALARELEDQAVELEQQTEEAQALAEELEQTNQQLVQANAEAEAAREAAEVGRARLVRLLECAPSVMAIYTGPEHVITYVNPAWERMVGKPNALGQRCRDVFPEVRDSGLFELLDRVYETGEPYVNREVYAPLERWGSGVLEDTYWDLVWQPLPGDGSGGRDILVHAVDITSQVQARREAESARGQAEAANAAKSGFLATMSHELRTPLNAIMGYAELLEMGLAGPVTEQQWGHLGRMRRSAQHLLALINDVLDLAKVEAEQLGVRREPGAISAAVEGALALVHPQAASRGLTVTNACGWGGPAAYVGDSARVEQVLVNLLSNAVRFTDPPGAITLTCGVTDRPAPDARLEGAGPWAYVRVEDTGIGISPDQLATIWEPFVQADGGLTRARGGTGLGLTISRKLARLMGGDLTAWSQPGSGSAFFLWLPAAPAPEAALVATTAPERRGEARYTEGLAEVGDHALAEVERILDAYAARLRADPAVPSARTLTETELEDHAATLLADIAQCLAIIEHARGAPTDLMRDSTLIQRVVAERHGRQRERLGWSEPEVRREFEILREEVARAVRRRAPKTPDARIDRALALCGHFIEHAEQVSVRSLQVREVENLLPPH
jgi:signal transduction histidine kinase